MGEKAFAALAQHLKRITRALLLCRVPNKLHALLREP